MQRGSGALGLVFGCIGVPLPRDTQTKQLRAVAVELLIAIFLGFVFFFHVLHLGAAQAQRLL